MNSFALLTMAVEFAAAFLHDYTEPPSTAAIRVEVRMVKVSPAVALSLVPELSDDATFKDACAKLARMIDAGEATLLGWPVVWLKDGIRSSELARWSWQLAPPPPPGEPSRSETIEERRYSTEFDPPQDSGGFAPRRPETRPKWGPIVPTTFETRNLGPSLEAEADVAADGASIRLILTTSYVRLLRFDHFHGQTSNLGITGEMVQPQFQSNKTTSEIRVRNDRPALLSVCAFSEPEPQVILFIVRAQATLLPKDPTPLPK